MDGKRILFIIDTLKTGGIQTSCINIANRLCGSGNNRVDVFVCNEEQELSDRLDDRVRIRTAGWRLCALNSSFGLIRKSGSLRMLIFKAFAYFWAKAVNNSLPVNMAVRHEAFIGDYDVVCCFTHEINRHILWSGYINLGLKKTTHERIGTWVHFDPDHVDFDLGYNMRLYRQVDFICCVSGSVRERFSDKAPTLKEKTVVYYNELDGETVSGMSAAEVLIPRDKVLFFSAARLSEEKGFARAITVMAPFLRARDDIVWLIAGDGAERERLTELIAGCQLQDKVVLMGNVSNPYPYIKNAALYLNVSYHEAAPMVFTESLFLGTPVFCTETSSARELLQDKFNAIICDNSESGLKAGFDAVFSDLSVIRTLRDNIRESQIAHNESDLVSTVYNGNR